MTSKRRRNALAKRSLKDEAARVHRGTWRRDGLTDGGAHAAATNLREKHNVTDDTPKDKSRNKRNPQRHDLQIGRV
jgi:hypothetical protein